jgi:flagellar hook-length control protein FliK
LSADSAQAPPLAQQAADAAPLSGTAKTPGGVAKTVAKTDASTAPQIGGKATSGSSATVIVGAGAGAGAGASGQPDSGDGADQDDNGQQASADPAADASAQAAPDVTSAAFTPTLPAAAAPSSITPTVTSETVARLASQIVQTAQGAASQFNLVLNPAELGGVQVKIQVDRHGAVSASMTFDNPQAAAELKAHASDLKAALSQAGFDVADDGLSFNLNGQGQQSGGDSTPDASAWAGRAFRNAAAGADDIATTVTQAASRLQGASSASGLDIRI